MHIAFVTLHYLPDGGPSAPLFGMLAERLAILGHSVTVVVTVPHYPSGRVAKGHCSGWLKRSRENGVEVFRVRIPSVDRNRLDRRFLQFLAYQFGASLATFKLSPDVVLASTPAIATWLPYSILAFLRRVPAVYAIYDVYPAVGIKLGVFRRPAVIRMVTRLEKSCLAHARRVRIISDSFAPVIKDLGVPDDKLQLIYDWVDTDLIRPLPRCNDFAKENGFDGRFVVLYAGNLGVTQGLPTIIEAAALLRDRREILFVFVGEGAGKESAMAEASRLELDNVVFLPYQDRSRLPEVLASAGVSLVTLEKGFGNHSIPSKLYSILASARPVIAGVDPENDACKIVEHAGAGVCVPPGSAAALAEAIQSLAGDPELCNICGQRGREYALAHHSPDSAARAFERLFEEVIHMPRECQRDTCSG